MGPSAEVHTWRSNFPHDVRGPMTNKVHKCHDEAAAYALQARAWIMRAWIENDAFLMQLGLRKRRIAWGHSDEAAKLEAKHGSVFPGVKL